MKKLIISILTVISVQAYAQGNFVVNGTLPDENFDGKAIYLKAVNNFTEFVTLDSSLVVKNTFSLKGTVLHEVEPALVFIDDRPAALVILESGVITLAFNNGSAKVGGTPHNEKYNEFGNKQRIIFEKLQQSVKNSDNESYQKLMTELKAITYNYLKENITNGIGEFFLADSKEFLNADQMIELIESASPRFRERPKIQALRQELSSFQPSVGDKFIDMKLKNLEGKEVSISDYIGKNKYILIDFWASWCGPCIRENPTLVEAYKKYKSKGFEIVGISLDESQPKWQQAVKNLDIAWPQMSDLGGWNSLAARMYKVNSIPMSFLLNGEGIVVEKNLRGELLLTKLDELLK